MKDLSGYRPNVEFSVERKGYAVKTVSDPDELRRVLRLRYEVFYLEFIGVDEATVEPDTIDFDSFDTTCDHLVIVNLETNEPIGTYRLRCSDFVDTYYTETEFDCAEFLKSPGRKLEMGRACIHESHRTGTVTRPL